MTTISLDKVTKNYGDVRAVDSVSFEVEEGEVLTLLGPSGCGKSTTLRMIAGFIYPDEGRIFFGDKDMTYISPQRRNTAMVFQSYALWPHLSVRKNVEFGLNIRKIAKNERDTRVEDTLERVRMGDLLDRMPSQLSGGQQQRVAVARALVVNPEVLLLDEPLSNLDSKLRVETRQEIRDLVKDLGLTTIFVTHDQSEALSISDRIAILDLGHLLQLGTPEEIWTTPKSAFVGAFIGEANTIKMEVIEINSDSVKLAPPAFGDNSEPLQSTYFKGITQVGQEAQVIIRPETLMIHTENPWKPNVISAKVRMVMFFGSFTLVSVVVGKKYELNLHIDSEIKIKRRQKIFLEIPPYELRAFGPEYH